MNLNVLQYFIILLLYNDLALMYTDDESNYLQYFLDVYLLNMEEKS